MADETYISKSPMLKLGGHVKYNDWEKSMFGRLMSIGAIGIIEGTEIPPSAPSLFSTVPPSSEDLATYNAFNKLSYKAAGEIYLWLDDTNKIHVDSIRTKPKDMWDKLKAVHSKSAPNSRFNSLSDLLSIRLKDDESLTDLTTRIQGAMQKVRVLRPKGYTLENLDEELVSMAMIKGLPFETYGSFISSVLLLSDLSQDSILQAFRTEETQRNGAINDLEMVNAAAARLMKCYICDGEHTMLLCPKYAEVRAIGKKDSTRGNEKRKRGGRGTNRGATAAAAKANEIEEGCDAPAVKAGAAAVCLSADSKILVSTDRSWNADTGASAHMTPHLDWITVDYMPWRVPICLANGAVIYSTGKGSVLFKPSGKVSRDVLIADVLHVPLLSNNLFSVLTLTSLRGFKVTIFGREMAFTRGRNLLLTATVNNAKVAYLDGNVVRSPSPKLAKLAKDLFIQANVVVDRTLMHKRLCHLGKDRLEQLIQEGLSSDLIIQADTPLADFCDACINGKQHRHPFSSITERSTELLGRIYSDLHGPMPVKSYNGHLYWVVFINEASRWLEGSELAKKSDLFVAFKSFKALVEKQTGRKIKCFHNDEGGEFIPSALLKFCEEEGIRIEFTTRATPQSNGVSERANRTISEAIISMNTEAHLPPSFWNFALNVYRHVHNRCPTSALARGTTPYEQFKGRKPKISHLCVYGCRAYVLIGQDKRRSLEGHTVKGVFVGYPPNHIGWMIYIPETRKVLVSRDVIFNENEFPGTLISATPSHMPGPSASDFILLDNYVAPESESDTTGSVPIAVGAPMPPPANHDEPEDLPLPPRSPTLPQPDIIPPAEPQIALMPPLPTLPEPAHPRRSTREKRAPQAAYDLARERQLAKISPLTGGQPAPHIKIADRWSYTSSSDPVAHPDVTPTVTEPLWDVTAGPADANGVQVVDFNLSLVSADALMLAGRAFVETGEEVGGYGKFAVNLAQNAALKVGAHDTNPRSYREAVQSDFAEQWYKAMAEEMNNHKINGTWTAVYLPAGSKSIGSRWVFKVKHMPDGTIDRFKARVVAQGFSQRPDIDFDDTFAPTARWPAVRTILAIAAIEDMHLESVDVTAAFLNSAVDAELYLRLPDGADRTVSPDIVKHPGDGPVVGLLHKGMYGLKQGAHLWHKRLNEVFLLIGFARVISDPCVYIYMRDGVRIITPVHVDDMTFASKDRPAIMRVIEELCCHFKLRHLGPTVGLLGVRVVRDRAARKLWIDQRAYAVDLLARFGMLDCKPATTPMDPNRKLSKSQCPITDAEKAEMSKIPYIQGTGSVLYLTQCTRPDFAKAVSELCRYNANPGMEHWRAFKHLLRFIRGTLDYRIEYSGDAALPGPQMFRTYSDADHGGNIDTGKSTSGYLIMIAGGAVDWSSKMQTVVAMSTTESEFIAASTAGRALCWMRSFLEEIGAPQKGPSELLIDNQSAISVSKHPEHMGRLKHLDRHFFWLRDAVYNGDVAPVYIQTADMIADTLTKPLARDLYDKFRRLMGVVGEWTKGPI